MGNQALQERSSYTNAFAITPSDSTVLPPTWGGLWVGAGVAATVVVTTLDGTVVTFAGVTAGTRIPVVAIKVMAATTATLIVGMN